MHLEFQQRIFSIIFISLGKMQSHLWMQRTEEQNTKKLSHTHKAHIRAVVFMWDDFFYRISKTEPMNADDGRRKSN